MNTISEKRVRAGIALYSHFVLSIYDWYCLGYQCRFYWLCPAHYLLELYDEHISASHLNIGIGTGYFIDKCKFPSTGVRLALMDLNSNSLLTASKRLIRNKPDVCHRNVLEPFDISAPAFDSIGMMNLLHCLPGNLKTKSVVFEHAKAVMNPGAVLFGSTILYRGIKRNAQATLALKYSNKKEWMDNMNDSLEDLRESSQRSFSESSVKVIGCEALFWARKQP